MPLKNTPSFAPVAALAGDPTRAAMLAMLFDGRAMPAGQLARGAGVSPATASTHLNKLVDADLLRVRAEGRHRYYEIARPEIAQALETLGAIRRHVPTHSVVDSRGSKSARIARSCDDHLAGDFAAALVRTLIRRGAVNVEEDGFRLRRSARPVLLELGIDTRYVFSDEDAHVKACLARTEGGRHICGPLGAALLTVLLERRLLQRRDVPGEFRITEFGYDTLLRFGIDLTSE
jgi:DNA-binding transcriptional ArsR family regulator